MTHPRDPERADIRDEGLEPDPRIGCEPDVLSAAHDVQFSDGSRGAAGVEGEPLAPIARDALAGEAEPAPLAVEGAVAAAEDDQVTGPQGKEDEKPRSGILEAIALVCVAFALALTLKSYVAEAYEIKGRSMEPSFSTGQRVIVLKAFYEVQRSDVIVFASTEDSGKDLIKRVVGLPGDRIDWRDGRVYVNGEPLEESYVQNPAPPYESARTEIVPEGHYYVLGDNRPDSHDSRYFHCVPEHHLKGEVVLRWWPFEDFHLFAK